MLSHLAHLTSALGSRWRTLLARPDAGYSSEAVLVTALLVALAIVAIGLIADAVTSKAGSIDFG